MADKEDVKINAAHIQDLAMNTERIEFEISIQSAKLDDIVLKGTAFLGRAKDGG